MSKIKKITVANLKAVSALTADFNGCTAIITGGNNKGKSSFLRSLPDRLRGIKPDIVLKHGEKDGFAEMELTTGERFIWIFDGKREKLTFITEKNIPTSVTKGIMAAYFPPTFDVDEFLNSTPAKQRVTLQKLTGIDFSEIDKLYKEAYEVRTYANKRLQEETVKNKDLMYDPKLPFIEMGTEEFDSQLKELDAHNLKVERATMAVDDKKKKVAEADVKITEIKASAEARAQEIRDEIARLEKMIVTVTEKSVTDIYTVETTKKELQHEVNVGTIWLNMVDNKPKTPEDRKAIEDKIQSRKEEDRAIRENNAARLQQEAFDKAKQNAEIADKDVKKIEEEKADVIKNASMPDGFGFNDEGITYNGLPFTREQLSSSGIYIGALKLAAIGLGEVKTLHFDASFLDKNSLADIEKWAESNDLQLLIERPDFEGGEIEYQIVQEVK